MSDRLKGYLRRRVYHLQGPRILLLFYILTLCVTHGEIHFYVKILLVAICLPGIADKRISGSPLYWGVIAILLVFNSLFRFSIHSNHYFLLAYIVLTIIIVSIKSRNGSPIQFNPYQALISITFGLAVLQKVLNPYFISGKLIGTYILGGGSFYKWTSFIDPGHRDRVNTYYEVLALAKGKPFLNNSTELAISLPGENFILICVAISILIICSEFVVFIFATSNKLFNSPVFIWILIGFVWGTFLFRQEYAFFALLLILLLLAGKNVKKLPSRVIKLSTGILMVLDLVNHFYF